VDGDRDAAVALMRETCDAALVHGLDVVVERHLGSLADTPEHTEQLLVDVDRENFALNHQVLDLLPAEAIEAQPADAERLAPHARYFHLKNYLLDPDSGRLLHGASLAAGSLDYQAILAAALRAGYSGPLTIEFLSCEQQPLEQKLADDVSYLRGVLQTIGSRALP